MKKLLIILVLIGLAACTPVAVPNPTETDVPTNTPAEATLTPKIEPATPTDEPVNPQSPLEKVRLQIAAMFGYGEDQVVLLEAHEVTFRDGCLEAAQTDEMCIQVLTPGYRARYDTPAGQVWYHLNEDGSVFRQGPEEYTPLADPES